MDSVFQFVHRKKIYGYKSVNGKRNERPRISEENTHHRDSLLRFLSQNSFVFFSKQLGVPRLTMPKVLYKNFLLYGFHSGTTIVA